MLRVLIADDHALLRSGLRRILAEALAPVEVGEAKDALDLLAKLPQAAWDLVLLDVSMPGRGGLDVLRDLKERWPRLPVLVLSMHPEEQFAIPALRAGASGYITKEKAPEELIEAVRRIIGGRRFVSQAVAERLVDELAEGRTGPPHEALSAREFEVLRQLTSGRTVTEIADRLGLSVKTISTYRARILEKMALGSNAELVQYAVRHGLIS